MMLCDRLWCIMRTWWPIWWPLTFQSTLVSLIVTTEHLTPLHSWLESLICLHGECWRQDFWHCCLWEGKWRRGDVLNSPLIHCTPVLHCLIHTLSWYSLSLWGRLYTLFNGGWRHHHWTSLVSSLHLQAVETYRYRLVTSLTWKQTGINTFGDFL